MEILTIFTIISQCLKIWISLLY